jgi:hypothetical protein
MRWLALVLILPLIACESRVIVSRTPAPQGATPSASPTASSSPTASPAPTKAALRPLPSFTPATRLLSYEQQGDTAAPSILRLVLTDDGRVITRDAADHFVQRKLTPAGAAALVLQAIETGLFDRDATHPRVPRPGTTPPARGPTFVVITVANGPRVVRVSAEPSGQPDDEMYQPSATRDKLTALARGYEDLSWIPASHWAEANPQRYQPIFHRLWVQTQSTPPGPGSPPDAEAIWPFLVSIDALGQPMGGTAWRCAVIVDDDARALAQAPIFPGYGAGAALATAALARAAGSVRFQISPLLPHEPASCDGAPPPPF